MTPQERDLITQLLGRLAQAGGQPKDPEADQLIRQAVAAQPDAPYYLVQTVLIQDMALHNAQSRIEALEQQLAAAKPAQTQPTSFLGGLFGGGPATTNPAAGSVPSAGPWSRPAPAAPAQAAPQFQGQPGQAQPWQGQPGYGQPGYGQPMGMGGMMGMGGGGSGFLRSAATTAAGIAGGALLFEGIQSMFGSHAGGILSGTAMQPGLSETVINNYYGSDPAGGNAPQTAAWDQGTGSNVEPADYTADNSADPDPGDADQDVASDQDFGGSDSDVA
jgi:hypothetical protein